MTARMKILLASTYELGHQPLHVATAAAALRAAGHEVTARDLSLVPLTREVVEWAEGVAFSVPMHTATRLAIRAARRIREVRPATPICFYGLYAAVPAQPDLVDEAIPGEYEAALVEWVAGLAKEPDPPSPARAVGSSVPDRRGLPDLDNYTRLLVDGERRRVGYVESSRGCRHRCRHCPIPPVYDGRIRIVDESSVLQDVARLVDLGAEHISFGDPDFLNAPHHSLRVARSLHRSFPRLTFDVTTKVDLILRHRRIWAELADLGLLFVVSAFETTNDRILGLLDKGHTVADEAAVVHLLRNEGIEIRPTWMPFTPWTGLDDMSGLVTFLAHHDLFGNVDPVQLTIRLLIPAGSLLLQVPELVPHLGEYDREALTWTWRAADPRVDDLHLWLSGLLTDGVAAGEPDRELMNGLVGAILEATDAGNGIPMGATKARPRLTEPWFC